MEEKNDIKVFYKNDKGTFRRILNSNQYLINQNGQIILPENHYSKGYVERIVSGIKWEEFPLFLDNKEKKSNDENNNDIDFYLDNK